MFGVLDERHFAFVIAHRGADQLDPLSERGRIALEKFEARRDRLKRRPLKRWATCPFITALESLQERWLEWLPCRRKETRFLRP